MTSLLRTFLVIACCAAAAAAQTKPAGASKPAAKTAPKPAPAAADGSALPSEEVITAFMNQMVGYNGGVTFRVADVRPTGVGGLTEVLVVITDAQGSNTNRFFVTGDGKHAVTGDIIPFGPKPFEESRVKLEKSLTGPSKGPSKSPVTIVEFSDMQCPHCKEVAPVVESLLAQEPDAHFVFQNFPLPNHDWAQKAAGYVDCIGRDAKAKDAVWKFVQKTFEQQESITAANADEKLKAIATDSGSDADAAATCAVKPETQSRIEASLALGKSVGVNGTPSIFINGRMLTGGVPLEVMKQIVDFQKSDAAK
jgi:protein-disulfide isomerase